MHELTPRMLVLCLIALAFAAAAMVLVPWLGDAHAVVWGLGLVLVSVAIALLVENLLWARGRLARSHDLAAGLSMAMERSSVAAIVVERGMRAAAADTCTLHVLDASGRTLELIGHRGVAPEVVERIRRLRPEHDAQTWTVMETGCPLWVESPEQYHGLYPELSGVATRSARARSFWAAPLVVEGRAFGVLGMGYYGRHRFTRREREFIEAFTRQCAQALLRAERQETEREARRAAEREQQRADAANRAKDEFLATVSHELRTPLNAILGWSNMLERDDLAPDKRRRALDVIQRNATAMAKLVEDLLDVSRIVSGKLRLDVADVDLARVIEVAIDTVRPAAEAKLIRIRHALERSPNSVLGDAARLQQVVWNLLSNAVKFTPKGGEIEVTLRMQGDMQELTVKDTGVGMDPRFVPHVFEPFRQADGSISRAHRGLGLGLAITKHLVEVHGGMIEAHSAGEGQGSCFVVHLPVSVARARGHAPLAQRMQSPSLPTRGNRSGRPELHDLRILVVDDEEDARQLVREVLEHWGAQVDTAGSAAEALQLFVDGPPDVLLSDIGMPGESGYDLIRRIRTLSGERGGNVPAAALTAYARPEDRRRALDAGYLMHLPKPVDPNELLDVVTNLVRSARSEPAHPAFERS